MGTRGLRLGNNRIGDDGARYIFEGLVQNARTITTLQYVPSPHMRMEGQGRGARLATSPLQSCCRPCKHTDPCLESIPPHRLNNNNIGPNGARYIVAGLPAQLSLNTLLYVCPPPRPAPRVTVISPRPPPLSRFAGWTTTHWAMPAWRPLPVCSGTARP